MAAVSVRRAVGKVVLAVVIAVLAFGAIPAGATIYERGRFTDNWSETINNFCGVSGLTVSLEGTASGQFRLRQGKGKTESAFFLRVTQSFREVYTNVSTGESFVIRGHATFNEVKATRVSGTVFRFVAVEAGQPFVIQDSEGRVVLRDRGAIRTTLLFDTRGDAVPGGDFLDVLDVRVSGPHPGFDLSEEEFCQLATGLIAS